MCQIMACKINERSWRLARLLVDIVVLVLLLFVLTPLVAFSCRPHTLPPPPLLSLLPVRG